MTLTFSAELVAYFGLIVCMLSFIIWCWFVTHTPPLINLYTPHSPWFYVRCSFFATSISVSLLFAECMFFVQQGIQLEDVSITAVPMTSVSIVAYHGFLWYSGVSLFITIVHAYWSFIRYGFEDEAYDTKG